MFFFFFKQKTAYEMLRSLVGSEMCIRDRCNSGPNTNGSHFFICTSKPHPTDYDETLTRTKHLNTNHVCFGNLVSGKDVLEELQARMEAMVVDDVGFMPAHSYDSPQFVVVGCGSVAAEASE
eukprot:TRINITY_DN30851_c0_g1_i2.p1 TRINITY_DN30851_c0_g1~~TRINITY_DN30851_c0_g1_i2.p1  ORF type:complete len:122 (-),score=36.24 TRINITY_DN30851_c0_g1_i2:167-532(-)